MHSAHARPHIRTHTSGVQTLTASDFPAPDSPEMTCARSAACRMAPVRPMAARAVQNTVPSGTAGADLSTPQEGLAQQARHGSLLAHHRLVCFMLNGTNEGALYGARSHASAISRGPLGEADRSGGSHSVFMPKRVDPLK